MSGHHGRRAAATRRPPVLGSITNKNSTSGLTTYTFTSVAFDAAPVSGQKRYIVVAIAGVCNTSPRTLSSVTIGGVAATALISRASAGSGTIPYSGIAIAEVPTGTSGSVVVTMSGAMYGMMITAYVVYDLKSAAAVSTDYEESSANAPDIVLTTSKDGFAFAVNSSVNGSTHVWTNATEDYDVDVRTGEYCSSAHASTAAGSLTITATQSVNDFVQLVGAALR